MASKTPKIHLEKPVLGGFMCPTPVKENSKFTDKPAKADCKACTTAYNKDKNGYVKAKREHNKRRRAAGLAV